MDWQPAELAPKDARRILLWSASWHHVLIGSCWWMQPNVTTWYDDHNRVIDPPTHWMPLPDPPAKAEE